MGKRIYIAGPVSGVERNVARSLFGEMERVLKDRISGVQVFNPAKLPDGFDEGWYMQRCMRMVEMADGVVFMRGWEFSEGARAEWAYAVKLRKELFYL